MTWILVVTTGVVTSFVVVGVVAWRMRPRSRVGALMVGVGVAYLVNRLPVFGRMPAFVLVSWTSGSAC